MTETQSNVHYSLLTWKLWGERKKNLRKEIFKAEQETRSVHIELHQHVPSTGHK